MWARRMHSTYDTVRQYYKCSCDWKGERYCGLTIKCDYEGKKVHIAMHGYVSKALTRFQHPPHHQDSGLTILTHQTKLWGKDAAWHGGGHISPPRQDKEEIHPRVYRVFLFLAHRVDGSLLPSLSALTSHQANLMEQMMDLCKQFLDYMASEDKAILMYKASGMVLAVHSKA
jgi:hypothetical protein